LRLGGDGMTMWTVCIDNKQLIKPLRRITPRTLFIITKNNNNNNKE